jgi:NAD(P)-dependent dehydrogenase (short-subunit alcohol dehydrogenase family)
VTNVCISRYNHLDDEKLTRNIKATKGLAAEYGPDNIRVNAIAPLLCGTKLFEAFVGVPDTPDNRAKFVSNVPLGRLTEPEDVANAALYLAGEGSFVTGINLEVDGGRAI